MIFMAFSPAIKENCAMCENEKGVTKIFCKVS